MRRRTCRPSKRCGGWDIILGCPPKGGEAEVDGIGARTNYGVGGLPEKAGRAADGEGPGRAAKVGGGATPREIWRLANAPERAPTPEPGGPWLEPCAVGCARRTTTATTETTPWISARSGSGARWQAARRGRKGDILGSTKWRLNRRVHDVVDTIWSQGGGIAGLVDKANIPLPERPESEDPDEMQK
uniref:Uncharacterized protein n=1 Tax=Zea mays TaxID=4577 RepID=A0A804LR18_MAIZE